MAQLTCCYEDCQELLIRLHTLGRPPKYCDVHRPVAHTAQKKSYGIDSRDKTCTIKECGRPLRARGVCNMHYKRQLRAEGKMASVWDERRKSNHHKRRALKLKLPADNIRPADVYERDEWTCGICAGPVDRHVTHPDPMSPSLDHILPLSRGGHHILENVQLAHLGCNVQKGARIESMTGEMPV